MSPQTLLMTMCGFATTLPVYMNRAAQTTDPVERIKLVMAANFSWRFHNSTFVKPLNPILGETFQAFGADGTRLFLEQTSHHPPRSHFLAEGPDGNFKMNGYLEVAIFAGLSSSDVIVAGYKEVFFKDGGHIRWNQNNDNFSGIFFGNLTHRLKGKIVFTDAEHDLVGFYEYNSYVLKK